MPKKLNSNIPVYWKILIVILVIAVFYKRCYFANHFKNSRLNSVWIFMKK